MNHRILLALAALIVAPLATNAFAQSSTWELNMRGGALRHDVFDESDTDFTFGGKLARYTAGGWGFGAAVDFADAGERPLADAASVDVRLLRYAAEIDRSFPASGRTRFTLGTGIGGATASYDGLPDVGNKSETNLMVPVSAGIKFMNRSAGPSWGLTLGARDHIVFLGDTDPMGNARDSEIAHHVQGTVGLSFFFGGGSKKSADRPRAEPAPTTTSAPVVDDGAAEREARERALAEIREKIFFDFDRFELKPASRETLQRKSEALRALPELRIVIEGHADERGTVEYNLALGEKRAKAALDYLADLGIDPERVSIVSYGEERPAVEGHGEAAWSQNRRDEFVPSTN